MENNKKNTESKSGSKWNTLIKNLKGEFRKIIWPDQKTLGRESVTVVVSAVVFGFIIALLDMIIKFGFSFII